MGDHPSVEPRYPIRVVMTRTGLSADALRVWEKRYGAVRPPRSAGRQRLYSEDDVARLTLLRRATAAGHRIAEVAQLDLTALEALVDANRSDDASGDEGATDATVDAAIAAAEALDGAGVEAALRRSALALGGTALVDRIVPRLLHEVGDRWHAGRLNPAQEHLASASVRRVLGWVGDAYAAAPHAPLLVVATPSRERHELGALLAATAAAEEGWRVVYLGPDLPGEDVLQAAQRSGARAVALSLVHDGGDDAVAEVLALARRLPAGVTLFVGGAAAGANAEELGAAGARVLGDIPALRRALRALRASSRVVRDAAGA